MDNNLNPYETPTYSGPSQEKADTAGRLAARKRLRLAIIILMIPAAYNYYCFDKVAIGNANFVGAYEIVARSINVGGIMMAACLLWFLCLPMLELMTWWKFQVVSKSDRLDDGMNALYESLKFAVYFALSGALLWMVWNVGYYDLKIDFYMISIPVGILANLLAAGIYVPLAYRWHRIEKAATVGEST
jgi:hypothetical protein